MRRRLWSPRAIGDLEAIRDNVTCDSELYAQLVVSRLAAVPDGPHEVVTVFHAARLFLGRP